MAQEVIGLSFTGVAGTGKSFLLKQFVKWYLEKKGTNIPRASAGEIFVARAVIAGVKPDELELMAVEDSTIDRDVDNYMRLFAACHQGARSYVVEGRLVYHTAPMSKKILLTCDFGTRIKRVADREKISLVLAEDQTRKREIASEKRYKKPFEELYASSNFDFVLDTTRLEKEDMLPALLSLLAL